MDGNVCRGEEHSADHPFDTSQQQTFSDEERGGVSDDGGESSACADKYSECEAYKYGTCIQHDKRGAKLHSHTALSSTRWDRDSVTKLRFQTSSLDIDTSNPDGDVLRSWLLDNADIAVDNTCVPYYPATRKTNAVICKAGIEEHTYHEQLRQHIIESLKEDSFVKTVLEFAAKYNLFIECIENLACAAMSLDGGDQNVKIHPKSISTILRWVYILKQYREGSLNDASVNHLLADLLEVAAYETKCTMLINVGEATACQVKVCGQLINVQYDIAMTTGAGASVIQIITSSEDTIHTNQIDICKKLPEIACKALASASTSVFGNDFYKTVFQVYVHSVFCRHDDSVTFHVFLIKCYVSTHTLDKMDDCPTANSLKPSFIMHQRLQGLDLRDPNFITLVYKALKGVLVTHKGAV
ncbi:uncharacterized protein [Ptychodera flava]|uniref:uncharacterized protein n=1 Tax=Ptychodera flava TaxID=63121 RepID=UPI003969E755